MIFNDTTRQRFEQEEDGKLVDGQGADTDTIVASARAYVHALNKLLVKRERTEPPAVLRA